MIELYDLTRSELATLLAAWGFSTVHAARLWKYLYREHVESLASLPDLPSKLHRRLCEETRLTPVQIAQETASSDGLTRKFLLQLTDGQQIETVLMRYRDRLTACVSSQAGCAYGCVFCATGQMGFRRHLKASEIVAQAVFANRIQSQLPGFAPTPLGNVVLMGMGEPLHNYDAVMQALAILHDDAGLSIAAKRLTLSTVGIVPGIIRLADERQPYSLAVSLHAATQDERAALLPVARTWPLDALIEACRYYTQKLQRKIFFEWTLIAGANDSIASAHTLGRLLSDLPAHVNLIPLNPTRGYDGAPGELPAISRFQAILQEHGLPSTVRQRRGIDIAAGCGQLAVSGR